MSEEQLIETTAPIENTGPSNEQVNQMMGVDSPAPAPAEPTAPAPQFDQAKMEAMFKGILEQQLNPVRATMGKLGQMQSEWDKQKQQASAYKAPASWEQLDPESRKTTSEIIKAAWQEQFGEKWDQLSTWQQQQQEASQKQETFQSVMAMAGEDFKSLDPIMGNIYREAQQAANNGDQRAARFIQELMTTDSGKYRLVDIARQMHKQTLEANGQQAQQTQADARKRASTSVQASRTPTTKPDDLASIQRIKDPAKRLEALKERMDARG